MDAHPLAEQYPPLSPDEFERLKASIAVNDCVNPVWTYEGKILDGRHRYRACRELGKEPVFAEYHGDDPAGFAELQNEHRRHLTAEFRRQRVTELRAAGKSTREIAKVVGVHHTTVIDDLKKAGGGNPPPTPKPEQPVDERRPDPRPHRPDNGPVGSGGRTPPDASPAPAKVTGRDGKQYPATKPKPAPERVEPSDQPAPTAPTPRPAPQGVGISRAVDAINALKRIPITDPLRDAALDKVLNYVKAERKRKAE